MDNNILTTEFIDKSLEHLSPKVRKNYKWAIEEFLQIVKQGQKELFLDKINNELINIYINNLKAKGFRNSTINQKLTTLKAFFNKLGIPRNVSELFKVIEDSAASQKEKKDLSDNTPLLLDYLYNEVPKNNWYRAYFFLLSNIDCVPDDLIETKLNEINVTLDQITIDAPNVKKIIQYNPVQKQLFEVVSQYWQARNEMQSESKRFFITNRMITVDKIHLRDALFYIKRKLNLAKELEIDDFIAQSQKSHEKYAVISSDAEEIDEKSNQLYSGDDIARRVLVHISNIIKHKQKLPNTIFINGEALIGKSYILSEIKRELQEADDVTLLSSSIYPTILGSLPIHQMIMEVKNKFEEYHQVFSDNDSPYSSKLSDPKAFQEIMFSLAKQRSVVLILDDFDKYDVKSTIALRYLMRSIISASKQNLKEISPIVIVAAQEKNKEKTGGNILIEGMNSRNVLVMEIDKNKNAKEIMAKNFAQLPSELASKSPSLITEYLMLSDKSKLKIETEFDEDKILEKIIGVRFDSLNVISKSTIEHISVGLGYIEISQLISSLHPITPDSVLSELVELSNQKLLISNQSGGKIFYSFRNRKFSDIIYFLISQEKRRKIHLSLAKCIKENTALDIESYSRISYHMFEARNTKETFRYSVDTANTLMEHGLSDMASVYYKRALFVSHGDRNEETCNLYFNAAKCLGMCGEHNEAIIILNKVIQSNPKKEKVFEAQKHLADLYLKVGQYKEAIKLCEKIIIREKKENKTSQDCILDLIYSYNILGRFNDAECAINKYLNLADIQGQCLYFHSLGVVNYYKGQYDKSLEYFSKAQNLVRKLNDIQYEFKLASGIAMAHYVAGDIEKALSCYVKAYSLLKQSDDFLSKGIGLRNIAMCQLRLGRYATALDNYILSGTFCEQVGNIEEKARVLVNLAQLYSFLGAYKIAQDYARKIFEITNIRTNEWLSACAYQILGETATHLGFFDEGRENLERAMSMFHDLNMTHNEYQATLGLAENFIKMNNLSTADKLACKVLESDFYDLKVFAMLILIKGTLRSKNCDLNRVQKYLDEIAKREGDLLEFDARLMSYYLQSVISERSQNKDKSEHYLNKAKLEIERVLNLIPKELENVFLAREEIREICLLKFKSEKFECVSSEATDNLLNKIKSEKDLNLILRAISSEFEADKGFLVNYRRGSFSIISIYYKEGSRSDIYRSIDIEVLNKALNQQIAINSCNIYLDGLMQEFSSSKDLVPKSVLAISLNDDGDNHYIMYFEKGSRNSFSQVDEGLLNKTRKDLYEILEKYFPIKPIAVINRIDEDEVLADTEIIYQSQSMKNVIKLVQKLSKKDVPVLISGESGVGKEIIAKMVHKNSNRAAKPFVVINCAAIPESLAESELFGHVKGAFSGAIANKVGLFEEADGGTVFLDEVGEMSSNLQKKFLRVIQERTIRKVGDVVSKKINIRIISATRKNLADDVRTRNFREDLYYRLNIAEIKIPPLRERIEDIVMLVKHFIEKYFRRRDVIIDEGFMLKLKNHNWQGNVRELENFIRKLSAIKEGTKFVSEDVSFIT